MSADIVQRLGETLFRCSINSERDSHRSLDSKPVLASSPLDLPSEVFSEVLQYLYLHDLWRLLGVSRRWRTWMLDDKVIWRHFDLRVFKPDFRRVAVQRLARLADHRFTSLEDSSSVFPEIPSLFQSPERIARRGQDQDLVTSVLTTACNRLRRIDLAGSDDSSLLRILPAKELLKHLSVSCSPNFDHEEIAESLHIFPNLEDLIVRAWLPRSELESPVSTYELPVWGSKPVAKALKRFWLGALTTAQPPYLNRTARLIAPYVQLPADMQWLNLKSLAITAPNLEALHLQRFHFCHTCNQTDPDALDLRQFGKLTTFSFEEGSLCHPELPLLPSNLQELRMTVSRRWTCPIAPDQPWITRRQTPYLPNLRLLSTNLGSYIDLTFGRMNLWFEIITKSGCRPEELYLENPQAGGVGFWKTEGLTSWSPDLCQSLARLGFFTQVRRLELRGYQDPFQTRQCQKRLIGNLMKGCPKLTHLCWMGIFGLNPRDVWRILEQASPSLTLVYLESTCLPGPMMEYAHRKGIILLSS